MAFGIRPSNASSLATRTMPVPSYMTLQVGSSRRMEFSLSVSAMSLYNEHRALSTDRFSGILVENYNVQIIQHPLAYVMLCTIADLFELEV